MTCEPETNPGAGILALTLINDISKDIASIGLVDDMAKGMATYSKMTSSFFTGLAIGVDYALAPDDSKAQAVAASGNSAYAGIMLTTVTESLVGGLIGSKWKLAVKIGGAIFGGTVAYWVNEQLQPKLDYDSNTNSLADGSGNGVVFGADGTLRNTLENGSELNISHDSNGNPTTSEIKLSDGRSLKIATDGSFEVYDDTGTKLSDGGIGDFETDSDVDDFLDYATAEIEDYFDDNNIPLSLGDIPDVDVSTNAASNEISDNTVSMFDDDITAIHNSLTGNTSYGGETVIATQYADGSVYYQSIDPTDGSSISILRHPDGSHEMVIVNPDGTWDSKEFCSLSGLTQAEREKYDSVGEAIREQLGKAAQQFNDDFPDPDKNDERDVNEGDSDGSDSGGPGDDEGTPDEIEDILDGVGAASVRITPLILDLGGNGTIDLLSVLDATAYFDLDQDGFAENAGWVDSSSGDGFLVFDSNEDGTINDLGELFGTTEEQGFAELALLDSNADGVIDFNDADFTNLQLWVDSNGNGYSEVNELHTLGDYSIASISLTHTRVDQNSAGNTITDVGTFTYTDSSTGNISDVWLAVDQWNTVYDNDYLLDFRTLFLPELRGYGEIADLHIAMSLDNGAEGLLEFVSDIVVNTTLTGLIGSDDLYTDVAAIMFRWAGVDGIDPNSRGSSVDGRELAYLEKLVGQDYLQRGHSSNPQSQAGKILSETFDDAFNAVYARLLLQAAGADLFTNDITYDLPSDSFSDPGAIDSTALSALQTVATNAYDPLPVWQNVLRLVIGARGGESNVTTADETALDAAIYASDNTLSYSSVLTSLSYTSTVQSMTGTGGDDTINGSTGEDEIEGLAGNDDITGNEGDDVLEGSTGSDTYYYDLGDGNDWIIEYRIDSDVDVIEFGSGITSSDIVLTRVSNNDLRIDITVSGYESYIIVDGQFEDSSVAGGIEKLVFYDTSEIDIRNVDFTLQGFDSKETLYGIKYNGGENDTIYGNGGNDKIFGYDGEDTLYGGDGDDTIYGGSSTLSTDTDDNVLYGNAGNDYLAGGYGEDELTGGTGNDTLIGSQGNDTYYFNLGDGNDTIIEDSLTDTDDRIIMGAGIEEEDLSFIRVGNYDLRISINGGLNGSIYIEGQFDTYEGKIEYVELDDTTEIELATLDYGLYGTASNETLNGTSPGTGSGNDTIFGEGGNDTINGYLGSDELHGGDGNDYVHAGSNSSTYYSKTTENWLYGDDGDDQVYGAYGTDHITGGKDDDDLRGRKGSDNYYFFRGDGNDTIIEQDQSVTDRIYLGDTIALSDVSLVRVGSYDLKVLINDGYGGSITIKDQFRTGSSYGEIEYINLYDSTEIDLFSLGYTHRGTASADTIYGAIDAYSNMEDTLYGGEGNDNLYASSSSSSSTYAYETNENWLYGEAGNDNLYGAYGDDTFSGGTGNDSIRGRKGDDSYHFDLGDGDDTIYEEDTTELDDVIYFGAGIEEADLSYVRSGHHLIIKVNDGVDGSITINNQFYNNTNYGTVETIILDDETEIDLFSLSFTAYGTSSAETLMGTQRASSLEDTLYGGDGNDYLHAAGGTSTSDYSNEYVENWLYGENGNDYLYGANGDDTLSGGDGSDYIYGRGGADIFTFEAGESGIDTIYDFSTAQGDKLDLSGLLTLYDPLTDAIGDFVEITDSGSNSIVKVDVDGGADNFVQIATLNSITGLTDEEALETAGTLIAA